MNARKFPELLYVTEPVMSAKRAPIESYEGYADLEFEEGETVAVYRLDRVCHVRIEKTTILADEPGGMEHLK